MEIRKTEFGVSNTGSTTSKRVDMIVQQIWYGKEDCDGHETEFTYDYTGLETANKFPWTHSKIVDSWRIGAGADLCGIAKTEGNHVKYVCKMPNHETDHHCQPGEIDHFGSVGVRVVLYATMKLKPKEVVEPPAVPVPSPTTEPTVTGEPTTKPSGTLDTPVKWDVEQGKAVWASDAPPDARARVPEPKPKSILEPIELEADFIKSTRSSVYHNPECGYVRRMKYPEEVQDVAGLRPCKRCKP